MYQRIVILGRGGAGKSTAAVDLGRISGLPVIELDKLFWGEDLAPLPVDEWSRVQEEAAALPRWIMDGDLGPYDALEERLKRADTVVVLDFSAARCLYRAARRSRERLDFWVWTLLWRRHSRPVLLQAVARWAGEADVHVLRTPSELHAFLLEVEAR